MVLVWWWEKGGRGDEEREVRERCKDKGGGEGRRSEGGEERVRRESVAGELKRRVADVT